MGDYDGTITVQLVGSESGIVYSGSHNLTVHSTADKFKRFELTFNSSAAPNGNNEWRLLFDASKVMGALNFGLVELFPPTYKNRPNGLRNDVASFLAEMKPAFLRLPGGNNLCVLRSYFPFNCDGGWLTYCSEGLDVPRRWMWNQTIGPTVDRPGRDGN